MDAERRQWEVKNERNKTHVRWVLVLAIAAYLSYLIRSGRAGEIASTELLSWTFIAATTGAMSLLNLVFSIIISRAAGKGRGVSPLLKYATMAVDFLGVTAVLLVTGGNESYFFMVYLIVIISNGMRYGMKMAIAGALLFNALYVLALVYQFWPEMQIEGLQRELLKISALWMVSLYVGYLARRFERLQGEVERYQKLTAALMERRES